MGHVRLGRLPRTRNWRAVVELLETGAPVEDVASQAATAAKDALLQIGRDPQVLNVVELLARLPLEARAPGYSATMAERGIDDLGSVPGLLAGLANWMDLQAMRRAERTDVGEIAQAAFLSALTDQLTPISDGFFEPSAEELRRELGRLSSSERFASFARGFFAGVVRRTLDYYLSRELSNHVGEGKRFRSDADRAEFDNALAQHSFEAARIVESYAGGWYGKTVWQRGGLTSDDVRRFTSYSMTKLRRELEQREHAV